MSKTLHSFVNEEEMEALRLLRLRKKEKLNKNSKPKSKQRRFDRAFKMKDIDTLRDMIEDE